MKPEQILLTTAAARNAAVKLRSAAHYYCTSGECGEPLAKILKLLKKRSARIEEIEFMFLKSNRQ